MSLHDSPRPVDPKARARRLFRIACSVRAWGEDWISVGRVTSDHGFRDFGQQHIGLSNWLAGLACQMAKQVSKGGAALTDGGGAAA